ncbi:MAG TPA: hypothetical protein PKC18_20295, partial [Lacipirellulaceae bacterium]|nr:hypothetical protein [Lacipirellulaceae bacterium]
LYLSLHTIGGPFMAFQWELLLIEGGAPGALVGARGYGQPILTGIRLNNTALIMQGAIPAACLALALQAAFELAERWIVPAGLRLTAASSSGESSHVHAS